ncbi:MAG: response regulator [Candidatus Pacearchaeota archaeon]
MKRVLLIEDEMRLHKLFEDLFRAENLELISAYDGQSGLNFIQATMPDLIILDLILPRKSGFEVLEEIKKDSNLENIPVIVLTNVENKSEIEKAKELGVKDYLIKANYSLEDILKKIREILEEKEK